MSQNKGNKAKHRRSGKDSGYYKNQVYVTLANKARRAKARARKAASPGAARRKAEREAKHAARYVQNVENRRLALLRSKAKKTVSAAPATNEASS